MAYFPVSDQKPSNRSRTTVTAKLDEPKLEELKRLLQRLDKTMQVSGPAPKNLQGFAPQFPVGQEVALVPPSGAVLAPPKAGIRGRGASSASSAARTFLLAAGASATVSLAIFTLLFGGITTPQRQITVKAKPDTRPTTAMHSELGVVPAQDKQANQATAKELQAPVVSSQEPVRAAKASAGLAMVAPDPAGIGPASEQASQQAPAPWSEPSQKTAALKDADNVPASNGTGGSALDELDAPQLLRRGLRMLSSGNVGAARLLLERAADLGSGEAAFALATTYDGAPGSPRSGAAVQPNDELALRWYEQAQKLGFADAQKRLSEIKKGSSPGG